MSVIARTLIVFGSLIVTGTFVTAQGQDESFPVRSSFTLPEQLRGPGALLEEAGN